MSAADSVYHKLVVILYSV